jgi:hypothetical protein
MRSVSSERFAPSIISGAITGSALTGDLRFICLPITMSKHHGRDNLTGTEGFSGCLAPIKQSGRVQRGLATAALLTWNYHYTFGVIFDGGGYRMRAHRTMNLALRRLNHWGFHLHLHLSPEMQSGRQRLWVFSVPAYRRRVRAVCRLLFGIPAGASPVRLVAPSPSRGRERWAWLS